MEEARQYSSLSWEGKAAGWLYIGGLIALLVGVVLQFLIGGQSVLVASGTYILSRATIRALVLARPDAFPGERNNWVWTAAGLLVLLGASAFLFLFSLGLLE